jgi:GntR family transcriptional regulator, transcriptional repressor for pyruvate dehydrogenase complex
MAATRFREIERRSAAQAVCDQVIALIDSGELEVGDRLPPEKELGRSLGVSRPVVREALERLRVLGLVVSHAGRGSFVASRGLRGPMLLQRYSAGHLHEVRSLLEVPGAGIAALRRNEADLDTLGATVADLSACEDPAEWVRLDAVFHLRLAEATHNEVQVLLVRYLRDLLVEQSIAVSRVPGRIARANNEHAAVHEAVIAGNRSGAEEAMARHLDRSQESWQCLPEGEDGGDGEGSISDGTTS